MENTELKSEEPRIEINWLFGVDLAKVVRRSWDNSYVVMRNGLPCHVPDSGEFADFFAQLDAYARAHPEVVQVEYPYVPTPEELAAQALEQAKEIRARAVAALTVEVDGMVFDGDEKAQERMARAVSMADSLDEETEWVLNDSSVAIVTAAQLRRACRAAGKAQTALWVVPYQN